MTKLVYIATIILFVTGLVTGISRINTQNLGGDNNNNNNNNDDDNNNKNSNNNLLNPYNYVNSTLTDCRDCCMDVCSCSTCDDQSDFFHEDCCSAGCCDNCKKNSCNKPPPPDNEHNCNKHTLCSQFGTVDISDTPIDIPLSSITKCLRKSEHTCIDSGSVQIVISEFNSSCCLDAIKAIFILQAEDPYNGNIQTIQSLIVDPCGSLPPCAGPVRFGGEESKCLVKGSILSLNVTFLDVNPDTCTGGFFYNVDLNASGSKCKTSDLYYRLKEKQLQKRVNKK